MKAAVKALLGNGTIAYHPELARIGGSITAGVFLSQMLYWTDKGKLADGWIWKTQEEWTKETALTKAEQVTARRHLKERGLLEEKYGGIPRQLYYRLNMERLMELLSGESADGKQDAISGESDMPEGDIVADSGEETTPAISETTREYSEITSPGGEKTGEPLVEEYFGPRPDRDGDPLQTKPWADRLAESPWMAWHPDCVHPQGDVSAEALQHVGWMVEDLTGLRPVDGEWTFWLTESVRLYRLAKGDWNVLERGIRNAWDREEKYQPGNISRFADEVRKAAGAKGETIGW